MIDFEGRILNANDRALTLFGFEREEIQSVYVADIIEEDDLPTAFEAIEHIRKFGFDLSTRELHVRNKRGRSIWLETTGVRIDFKYKPSMILGLARDITRRKLEEVSLRQIEKRYKTLFDKSFELMFVYDLYGKIVDANPRALNLLGYEREEIASMKLAQLMEKRDVPRAVRNTLFIFENGVQSGMEEYRLKTKTGGRIWVEVSGVLMEQRGQPPTIIGIGREISAPKNSRRASKSPARRSRSTGPVKSSAAAQNGPEGRFDGLLASIVDRSESALANIEGNSQLKRDMEQILETAKKALEIVGDQSGRRHDRESKN